MKPVGRTNQVHLNGQIIEVLMGSTLLFRRFTASGRVFRHEEDARYLA